MVSHTYSILFICCSFLFVQWFTAVNYYKRITKALDLAQTLRHPKRLQKILQLIQQHIHILYSAGLTIGGVYPGIIIGRF